MYYIHLDHTNVLLPKSDWDIVEPYTFWCPTNATKDAGLGLSLALSLFIALEYRIRRRSAPK